MDTKRAKVQSLVMHQVAFVLVICNIYIGLYLLESMPTSIKYHHQMDGLVFANKFRCILMCDHEHSLALKTFYHLGGILKFLCLYFQ